MCWEFVHVVLPLQSPSALSCCFHSSSENHHSQPHSLPSFTLLVPAHSDSLSTFSFSFLFFFWGVVELREPWHTSVSTLHSFIHTGTINQSTKYTKKHKRSIIISKNGFVPYCQYTLFGWVYVFSLSFIFLYLCGLHFVRLILENNPVYFVHLLLSSIVSVLGDFMKGTAHSCLLFLPTETISHLLPIFVTVPAVVVLA